MLTTQHTLLHDQQQGGGIVSDTHVEAWRSLLNAHAAAVRGINRWLDENGGLPLESYDVLLELFYAPQRSMRLRDLGERVVLTRSGISRLVSRLEKEGLLERASVSGDARGVSARLTDQGEAAFRGTWPLYAAGIQRHFASFISEEEAALLAKILNRVRRQEAP